MNYENRVAVVTGAAAGIGLSTARKLAEGGAALALIDMNEAGLAAAAEELRARGTDVLTFVCSVADQAAVDQAVKEIAAHFGHIDILVNNAGIYRSGFVHFLESSVDEWKRKIDVNILGTMYITRAVLPYMTEQRYGRVVNLASVAAVYGIVNMVDYSMTKGAVVGFTRALAKEMAEYNVLVNAVSPGNIRSGEDLDGEWNSMSFLDRAGSYDECANVICFLASDEASYVTGQNYQVDGGRRKM